MPPRKGLSFEEKRKRLQELFTETAEFFTLKELEKIATKRKGIVSQSVKEVLQSLVDDNLVNCDKCGNQTVYWCLPSEVSQKRRAKIERLQADIAARQREREELEKTVESLGVGRESSDEKTELLNKLTAMRTKERELDGTISQFAALNPEAISKMRADTTVLVTAANRWTDNIFTIQHWASSKHGLDKKEFNKQFEIPEELDYVED